MYTNCQTLTWIFMYNQRIIISYSTYNKTKSIGLNFCAEREGDWALIYTLWSWWCLILMPQDIITMHGMDYIIWEINGTSAKKGLWGVWMRPSCYATQCRIVEWNTVGHVHRTTFMRYGHGPSGIVGITLKPSTLERWALSLKWRRN